MKSYVIMGITPITVIRLVVIVPLYTEESSCHVYEDNVPDIITWVTDLYFGINSF